MKKIKESILKIICIILISSVVGGLLMTLSFCLPDASIQSNASRSSQQLVTVGDYPLAIAGFNGTMLDNYTDAIMINSASYNPNNLSAIERALKVPHGHADWSSGPIEDLYEYYNDDDAIMESEYYQRYWHGYIVLLRPLLMFCDYANIKFLYFVAHVILLFFFINILKKKTNLIVTLSFLVSYLCTYAFITPLSLQYSHVFFIMLISGIVLLKHYEILIEKGNIKYFFLIVGIITSYIDLLTYPLITLGINLILCILMSKNIKVKDVILYAFMWAIGYGSMWSMKWLICTLIIKENVFLDAYNQMVLRTGDKQNINILDVINGNLIYLKHTTTLIVYGIMAIINACYNAKNKQNAKIAFDKHKLISLLFVTIMPLLWYIVLKEHSSSHSVFTFRALMVSLFAVLAIPECISKEERL